MNFDSVTLNPLLKNHTPQSQYTHWTITDEELLARIKAKNVYRPGYRDGVIEVQIPADGFFSSIIELQPGMKLGCEYISRKEGEEPRRNTFAYGPKQPAKTVFAILYHRDVLAEDDDRTSSYEWEVVTVLASPTVDEKPTPQKPNTLIANHYHLDGGTNTFMSPVGFETALRESVLFWKDKIHCRPDPARVEYMVVEKNSGDFATITHQDDMETPMTSDSLVDLLELIYTWTDMYGANAIEEMKEKGYEIVKQRVMREDMPLSPEDLATLKEEFGEEED